MAGASLADQQAYITTAARRNNQTNNAVASVPEPHTGKKRLNQAQRRQMNAQFSIPVEPRQPQPQNNSLHHATNPK